MSDIGQAAGAVEHYGRKRRPLGALYSTAAPVGPGAAALNGSGSAVTTATAQHCGPPTVFEVSYPMTGRTTGSRISPLHRKARPTPRHGLEARLSMDGAA